MYGLILENLSQYISSVYGEEKWMEIRRMAKIDQSTFSTHHVYPDNLIPKLTSKACRILGVSEKEFLQAMGVYFVSFVGQYGYDRVLTVLGRHMRDFLNGLDNLHEYLKFSYPRMKAPSFFCENESSTGLTLHYRSTRRGFLYYTIGQIKEVGRHFYKTDVEIEVIKEETIFDTLHVMMQLSFDNRAFQSDRKQNVLRVEKFMLPVKAFLFLEIFPFCIVFDQMLCIKTIGNSLQAVMPGIVGKKITEVFDLTRPLIECTWRSILGHTNNIFELTSVEPIKVSTEVQINGSRSPSSVSGDDKDSEADDIRIEDKLLHLKGQMMFMEEWRSMVYLGTPVMRDLDAMLHTGLYINDLSMHDFSRDMVLAGQQQSAELKLALDQELQKSKQLEESMRKLDIEMKRTDELLYQMIPKQVADRLRRGEAAVDTCQFFESVTILFSDVVTFTEICSRITPMQVVSMLNSMYSLFDNLTEKHGVYKVETIGDAYMVVSGAPEQDRGHASKVCEMALDMVHLIGDLKDPSTGNSLRIRVGVHSGAVVAGVVGLKMPRYCLFGDAVNTASRMESTSEALKVHVSEKTKELLDLQEWEISDRGSITVKGKGDMKTYWLSGRKGYRKPSPLDHQRPTPIDSKVPSSPNYLDMSDTRSLYSPVIFEDVSKFSPMMSPTSSTGSSDFNNPIIEVTEPLRSLVSTVKKVSNITKVSPGPLGQASLSVGSQTSPVPGPAKSHHVRFTSDSKPAWNKDSNQQQQQDAAINGGMTFKTHSCCHHCHLVENIANHSYSHSTKGLKKSNVSVIHVAPRVRDSGCCSSSSSPSGTTVKSNACSVL